MMLMSSVIRREESELSVDVEDVVQLLMLCAHFLTRLPGWLTMHLSRCNQVESVTSQSRSQVLDRSPVERTHRVGPFVCVGCTASLPYRPGESFNSHYAQFHFDAPLAARVFRRI
jgi:hypothetical protein